DGMGAAGFTDYANGNYALTAQSAYHNAGTDGKDLGPDWTALGDATKNTLTGRKTATTAVVGRQIFYANSAFDNPAAGFGPDNAVALDKQPLLSGKAASFVNYTSYSRGINGIMIDIAGLADPIRFSIADLEFRAGNDSNPAAWSSAPAPLSITVRLGAGQLGSDRIAILWADGAIKNNWLQITVKATAITGLTQPDVFYFGNAVGETGNDPENAVVDAADEYNIASHRTGVVPTNAANPYDINRDRIINATDMFLARSNVSGSNPLRLIAPGISASAAAPSADYPSDAAAIAETPAQQPDLSGASPALPSGGGIEAAPLQSPEIAAAADSAGLPASPAAGDASKRPTEPRRPRSIFHPSLRAASEDRNEWGEKRRREISRKHSARDAALREFAADEWRLSRILQRIDAALR
ncbi:MAG: hypothetical protein IT426_08525, partial [Pirellulales bacterium]|nr:hypothetical protein [Pirellulales bacterium]